MISVSNFKIPKKIEKKKPSLNRLMFWYHVAIIEGREKEKKPIDIKRLTFNYYLFCKNKLLNGKELKKISEKVKLDDLDRMMKQLCRKLFSKKYLHTELSNYVKILEEDIEKIKPFDNLMRYKKTYEEIIKEKGD